MDKEQYRELCSNINDMGELASALEGVMEALARMLGDIYAVLEGAARHRKGARRG